MPNDNEIKDDWPQSLVMSLGTLFLLAGLGIDIALFAKSLERPGGKPVARRHDELTLAGQAARHPGALSLALGLGLLLTGYLAPRTRAK